MGVDLDPGIANCGDGSPDPAGTASVRVGRDHDKILPVLVTNARAHGFSLLPGRIDLGRSFAKDDVRREFLAILFFYLAPSSGRNRLSSVRYTRLAEHY